MTCRVIAGAGRRVGCASDRGSGLGGHGSGAVEYAVEGWAGARPPVSVSSQVVACLASAPASASGVAPRDRGAPVARAAGRRAVALGWGGVGLRAALTFAALLAAAPRQVWGEDAARDRVGCVPRAAAPRRAGRPTRLRLTHLRARAPLSIVRDPRQTHPPRLLTPTESCPLDADGLLRQVEGPVGAKGLLELAKVASGGTPLLATPTTVAAFTRRNLGLEEPTPSLAPRVFVAWMAPTEATVELWTLVETPTVATQVRRSVALRVAASPDLARTPRGRGLRVVDPAEQRLSWFREAVEEARRARR